MFRDKDAWHEAVIDTGIGMIINLPITWITIAIGVYMNLSVAAFALFQTIVFTVVSLIRKYKVRAHFSTKNKEQR